MLIVRTHQDADAAALGRAVEAAEATLSPLAGESRERLRERPAGRKAISDIACYYGVEPAMPDRLRAPDDELAGRLREHPDVEFAYVKRPIALPMLPPRAVGAHEVGGDEPPGRPDDYRPRQGYLDAAPEGIGAEVAWQLPGGRGQGVRLIDIEGEWRFSHEDLQHTPGGLVGGNPSGDVEFRNHGTNVIGMLGSVHNRRGVSGICPDAALKAVSFMPERTWGSARAIKLAADLLRAGDVLLLEMMRPGPMTPADPGDSQVGYLPVDYWPDDLTAIEYAVSLGVVVVEAAGNGFQHLDDPFYAGPGPGFRPNRPNPFMREGLDSGAIVVGAGAPPPGTHGADHGPDRSRLDFSNWGSCLDAQGWGREVTTTGGLGHGADALRPGQVEDRWYTDRFSGTSSAAPMVAGALACVQGVLRAAGRRPLTPAQARAALRETGSPQCPAPDGTLERIGNRPDIGQLVAWAMQSAPPADRSDNRRQGMKVTITIEDSDGRSADVFTASSNSAEAVPGGMEVPYIKGPSLVLTHEDGSKTQLDVEALKALVEEKKAARPS